MKFRKMHNNPPALFKYLSQGEGRGEVTACILCSNIITSQLWLTLNLDTPTPGEGRGEWGLTSTGGRGEMVPTDWSRCTQSSQDLTGLTETLWPLLSVRLVSVSVTALDWSTGPQSDVVTQTDADFRNKTHSDGKLLEWPIEDCLSWLSI